MFQVLAVGDVVGRPGRRALAYWLPRLREERAIDFVVVNAENAASGSGITPKIFEQIRALGVDVLTMGDHAYRQKTSLSLYESQNCLLRPANWPRESPGRGACVVEGPRGVRVGVIHLQGRVFMNAQGDFLTEADRLIQEMQGDAHVVIVDIHAEATSEKIALSWHLDGRVSLVFGTHTHVPTADAIIRPKGTAYITDVGMTGPYNGVIGRIKDAVLRKMRTNVHHPFTVAEGDDRLGAVHATIDEGTGRAIAVEGLWLEAPAEGAN